MVQTEGLIVAFRSGRRLGWVAFFCGPAAVLYTVFVVVPLATALWYSFYGWQGTTRGAPAGMANYAAVLGDYPYQEQVLKAFWHNVVFFAGTMLVQNTVGLGLAVLLHRNPRGKRMFQTLYSLPYLISPLVVGYLWSMMLSPAFGPVNAGLQAVGLDGLTRPWLGDPAIALPVVVLVNAWQWIGCPMLIFGAALAAVPAEMEEAAVIDGASAWKAFWQVRFPLIMPAVGAVTLLTFVGCFNVFDLVFALGGSSGGPGQSMDVLGLLFYRIAFQGGVNAIGLSSALAMVMFVVVFGVALVVDRSLRRREVPW
ncbi:sugar ABC transporter permease [Actinoplanes sp. NPDC051470]|uniref:carbohydrate ABC transporter permease n=1 Tax=unclassified Actinoplanes TaxID=2626549 RepID=UPI00342241A3